MIKKGICVTMNRTSHWATDKILGKHFGRCLDGSVFTCLQTLFSVFAHNIRHSSEVFSGSSSNVLSVTIWKFIAIMTLTGNKKCVFFLFCCFFFRLMLIIIVYSHFSCYVHFFLVIQRKWNLCYFWLSLPIALFFNYLFDILAFTFNGYSSSRRSTSNACDSIETKNRCSVTRF